LLVLLLLGLFLLGFVLVLLGVLLRVVLGLLTYLYQV